jgi:hypothetical protein
LVEGGQLNEDGIPDPLGRGELNETEEWGV